MFGTLDTTLKPTLINSAFVQWGQRHYNFPGATGQPDFSITNDLELGHNFGTDDQKYESRLQFADSLSWIKGNHVIKFGFDGNYIWDSDTFPGFTPVRAIVLKLAGAAAASRAFRIVLQFDSCRLRSRRPFRADVADAAGPAGLPPSFNGVVFTYAGTPLPTSPTACSAHPARRWSQSQAAIR